MAVDLVMDITDMAEDLEVSLLLWWWFIFLSLRNTSIFLSICIKFILIYLSHFVGFCQMVVGLCQISIWRDCMLISWTSIL